MSHMRKKEKREEKREAWLTRGKFEDSNFLRGREEQASSFKATTHPFTSVIVILLARMLLPRCLAGNTVLYLGDNQEMQLIIQAMHPIELLLPLRRFRDGDNFQRYFSVVYPSGQKTRSKGYFLPWRLPLSSFPLGPMIYAATICIERKLPHKSLGRTQSG